MARIRTLKPEINHSPQVMNLSRDARLLFFGLITQADDEGRGTADPRKLKAAIFPGDDDITSARAAELLGEVERQGLAVTYDANGHGRVYCLPTFRAHQYIQKPKRSVYPPPPGGGSEREPAHPIRVSDADDTRTGGSEGSDRKDQKDRTRAREVPVDNGDNSARTAREPGRLKKPSDPEEIERRRREAAALCERLAAGAKV